MKTAHLFSMLLLCGGTLLPFNNSVRAQFRTEAEKDANTTLDTRAAMQHPDFLSSILDPARFSMHQTYSFSYSSFGNQSVGLGVFTNTFSYKASDNIYVSADVSAVYSPFSSFGDSFSKSLNGVYLSSARLDWKLGDNTFMRVEYLGGPTAGYGFGSPFGSYYDNPFASTNQNPLGWRTSKASITH